MSREKSGLNTTIEGVVEQAKSEINILKNQNVSLTAYLKDLEGQRNKLSEEIIDLTEERAVLKKTMQEDSVKITETAKEKLAQANKKEAEVSAKSTELSKKTKEADDLIKSNQGLKENLTSLKEDVKGKVEMLNKLIDDTRETLKNI